MITLGIFALFLDDLPQSVIKAQTTAFTTLVIFEMVAIFFIRHSLGTKVFTNKYLYLAILSSILLQLVIIYSPLNTFFKTVPLSLIDWAQIAVFTLGLIISYWVIYKFVNPRILNQSSKKLVKNPVN